MTITVQLFAALAEAVGTHTLSLDLPTGATVSDALDQLASTHPRLSADRAKVATAVNLSYVGADHVLIDGDELALIGPVSGG